MFTLCTKAEKGLPEFKTGSQVGQNMLQSPLPGDSTPTPTQAIGATQPNHNNTKLRFARKVIARCINLMPFSGSNLNKWQQNGQERQTEKQSFGWLIANENSISRVESPCERLMSALSLSLLRRFENSFIINLQEFMNCS